jgi:hypothetical protein
MFSIAEDHNLNPYKLTIKLKSFVFWDITPCSQMMVIVN